ncbi:hypothetical protein CUMW_172540, partial [Citrus unshiu]
MPRSRKNENLIDKTFSIVANILLRIIPTTVGEKEAFTAFSLRRKKDDGIGTKKNGWDNKHPSPQSEGNYAEALQNYYEAMRLEIDPYDRSYILYNIGLIHT